MKRILIVFLLALFTFVASGCEQQGAERVFTPPFYGTAGYAPANFPSSSLSEQLEFWDDVDASSETYGVHVGWKDTKILGSAHKNTDASIVLVLGFETEEEWVDSADEFTAKAKELLQEYPRIKYLSIGNEVNLKYSKNPASFEKFKKAYKQIYTDLKAEFPELKIFTIFQLEAMKGKAALMGITNGKTQWSLFKEFEPYMDLAVFTSYPFFEYKTPTRIPSNYYSEIEKYTSKNIAFTEIGWPSRKLAAGYSGSEEAQIEFIDRFNTLIANINFEFANWLFINDLYDYKAGKTPKEHLTFDSVGLKYHDGSEKQAWKKWGELKTN